MAIEQLKDASEQALADINALLKQLSDNVPMCSEKLLTDIVSNDLIELWVVREGERIVGMGELVIVLKPEGIVAQIEDVVVDEGQRGKGYGKVISEKLIERSKARGARVIQLSSRFSRIAANALYQKLGFQLHETNSYHMKL